MSQLDVTRSIAIVYAARTLMRYVQQPKRDLTAASIDAYCTLTPAVTRLSSHDVVLRADCVD